MKLFLRLLFFFIPFLWSIYVCSQPARKTVCDAMCFRSEVVSVQRTSDGCAAYEMKVSFTGDCAHALSHFTVAVPCGQIKDLWNSENWEQKIGTDPTTGLTGFKIDDIPSFGETSLKSFRVSFTLCQTDACATPGNCWQPVVAYKAATCVTYDTLSIPCGNLKATLEKNDASCFGAHNGSLSVVISEGQEPYSYHWSTGATGESLTGLGAGKYSVTITDASGRELILSDSISEPKPIAITGVATPASCNGLTDGSIDVTINGGVAPYSFAWDNGAQTEDVEGLSAGNHTVTATDAQGCTSTATIVVPAATGINVTATQVKPDCNTSNGSIDLSVSGGEEPYSFAWSNGTSTEDLSGVSSGLYTVTVTDARGCTANAAYFLKDHNTLALSAISSPTGCIDDESGELDLSVSGGTAPYSFQWSTGATTEDLSGLPVGYYTVTVTDAKGCTASSGFTILRKTLQVNYDTEPPTCYHGADGSISLSEPSGGTAPYTYEWSNGATGPTISDLEGGAYTVTITDAEGCSRNMTITLTTPPLITASASVTSAACDEEGSFSVNLNVSGGTAPYSFAWSDGSTEEDRHNLETGSYQVVITDAKGCSISKEVVVEATGASPACLISPPESVPLCGSTDNVLSTPVSDADSYSWTVDGEGWSISSAPDSSTIAYIAGPENTTATFTLTVVKGACTKSCSYTVTTCTPAGDPGGDDGDGGGSEEPGDGEPGDGGPDNGEQPCAECFSTSATLLSESGTCRTYEMRVSTDGSCRHELSHWTLAIPCGTLTSYSNSAGWKMVYGQDPTTGLFGLKADDIDGFGKTPESFTVTFTICEESGCDLSDWDPTVAYKAGTCVAREAISVDDISPTVAVYPNPFDETVVFQWHSGGGDANLLIVDQFGTPVCQTREVSGSATGYSIKLEPNLPRGIYYYRLTTGGKTFTGKLSKR